MKVSHSVRIALLFGLLLVALAAILVIKSGRAESHSASTSLPDLEYLKAINSVGPPQDPQLLFLLMTQYANANRQGEGAEFFQRASQRIRGEADAGPEVSLSEHHRFAAGAARCVIAGLAPI